MKYIYIGDSRHTLKWCEVKVVDATTKKGRVGIEFPPECESSSLHDAGGLGMPRRCWYVDDTDVQIVEDDYALLFIGDGELKGKLVHIVERGEWSSITVRTNGGNRYVCDINDVQTDY